MQTFNLETMVRGWFVGDFEPSAFKNSQAEVGVKTYQKGDYEARHYHKVSTEITLVLQGKVLMNGEIYSKGDIIVIEPYEDTDFMALEDTQNVVVKIPASQNDKYLGKYLGECHD